MIREGAQYMPDYLLEIAYTPKGFATLIKNPQNRMDALGPIFDGLGGHLQNMWFAFGEYDLMIISKLPDNISAAAISMAISAGDAVKSVKTTPLMTMEEGIEAMKKATTTMYHPPSGNR
jgi:uncharacterized protein with GYD domain